MVAVACGCGLHDSNNAGGAINLAVRGEHVVVARGEQGIEVVAAADGSVVSRLDPLGDSDSYDDVTSDGNVVLALDADDELLTSFTLSAEGQLAAVTADVEVATGPYSGVSLASGRAVVSGGTCEISFVAVDSGGGLALDGTLTAFRGQPDATMIPDGSGALMSTHFSGSEDEFVDGAEFGVTTVDVAAKSTVATSGMVGAGFTDGGGTPASWPVRAHISGDLAYVAHGGGLDILRIEPGLGLTRLSHIGLSIQATDVYVDGATAYVTGVPARVVAVDVTDPASPVAGSETTVPGEDANPTAVVVAAGRILVAANAPGLVTLDPN
jgi:hypothetical protein